MMVGSAGRLLQRVPATVIAVVIVIVLASPVWSIMLHADLDLWRTDDAGNTHLPRIFALQRAFAEAPAYPRWISDLYRGYGYPVFNFYAPFMYLVGYALTCVGVSIWGAFEIMGVATVIGGATGTYALVRQMTGSDGRGRIAAIAAGLLYVVAPYPFITNLYLRGNLPEALSLGLLPWFLLAIDRVTVGRTPWGDVLGAAVIGAIVFLTHQLSGVVAAVVALLWVIGRVISDASALGRGTLRLIYAGVIASGIVAFAAGPGLLELDTVRYQTARMPLDRLLEKLVDPLGATPRPVLLHGPSVAPTPGAVDWSWTYTYTWGIAPTFAQVKPAATHAVLALLVVGLGGARALWRLRRSTRVVPPPSYPPFPIVGPLLVIVLAWFGTTTWSDPAWIHIPVLRLVQFPWRLFGPFSLGVAVGFGLILDRLAPHTSLGRIGAMVIATVAVGALGVASLSSPPIPRMEVVSHVVGPDTLMETEYDRDNWNGGSVTGLGEFTPIAVDLKASNPDFPSGNQAFDRAYPPGSWIGSTALIFAGRARIVELRRDGFRRDVTVEVETGGATIALHQLRFPGWRAYLDGVAVPIDVPPYDPMEDMRLGIQLIAVPAGRHTVTTIFGSTTTRLVSDGITALTAIALLGAIGYHVRRQWRAFVLPMRIGWVVGALGTVGFAGLASWQMVYEVRTTLPPQVVPDTSPNLIVAAVADLVRSGGTRISSPSGPTLGADKFVDVRWLLIGSLIAPDTDTGHFSHGGRLREWVYMHPTSRIAFDVMIPDAQTYFTAGMGLSPEAWYTDFGDGVRFGIDVRSDMATTTAYAVRLNPRAYLDEHRWAEVRVPLGAYVGKTIEVTLWTEPVDDVRNDWAGWGTPMVVVDRTLVRPPNGPIPPVSIGPRPTFRRR